MTRNNQFVQMDDKWYCLTVQDVEDIGNFDNPHVTGTVLIDGTSYAVDTYNFYQNSDGSITIKDNAMWNVQFEIE